MRYSTDSSAGTGARQATQRGAHYHVSANGTCQPRAYVTQRETESSP